MSLSLSPMMKLELPYLSSRHLDSFEGREDLDRFLRKFVGACASSVAVLDEFGKVLYVSRVWRSIALTDSCFDLPIWNLKVFASWNSAKRRGFIV